MADTWNITNQLRPHARPDALAPKPLRPQARPDAVSPEPTQVTVALDSDPRRPRLRPEDLGQLPESTQADATIAEALPLDRTALIGLFHGPDGGSALLRLSSGSVVKVAAGAEVAGGRVTAIGPEGLRLRKDGEEILLTMPG